MSATAARNACKFNCNEDDRLSFIVEWYDPTAALVRKYMLHFYDFDGTVEMFDMKNHRTFLRRSKVENVRLCDMYIGSTMNIMSRQLNFVDYANEYTRTRLGTKKERTCGLIKPDAVQNMGKILDMIWQSGLQITKLKSMKLSRTDIAELFPKECSSSIFNDLVSFLTQGQVIAIEIRGENAIQRLNDLLGPQDASFARNCAPNSIRARFGTNCIQNAAHGSSDAEEADRELNFCFPVKGPPRANSACYSECTCCIIKPHAILDGVAGDILTKILECGFEVTAIIMFTLERANAEEFYEIYKGVVQEYPMMVTELSSGPSIAVEIRAQDPVKTFREFCGPSDPEIARHLRPKSLRALFGKTKAQNAVHCTDLPEDGLLEVEYFFKILDR